MKTSLIENYFNVHGKEFEGIPIRWSRIKKIGTDKVSVVYEIYHKEGGELLCSCGHTVSISEIQDYYKKIIEKEFELF